MSASQKTGGIRLSGQDLPVVDLGMLSIPVWRYIVAAILILVFFTADTILPRGATPAIGYCLVPVILRRTKLWFMLGVTVLCMVLTAVGFWEEPVGAQPWMSIFDRAMVEGVLWLTFVLVRRQDALFSALLDQTAALRVAAGELRRSNADLERFASTAAHDLRGPLAAVGMLAHVLCLSNSVKSDTEATRLIDSIQSELQRMSGFIGSLLAYGHVGGRGATASSCDCSIVLERVKQSLQSEIDAQSAQITSDPLPTLRADPLLIAQLFQNLIENSIKYRGDAPPKIHISAAPRPDGSWLFSEHDNGVGLRPEDCDRVFTPFVQLATPDLTSGGIGLGLATCRRIVERHGGRIWVDSKPGDGATFSFTIPQPAEPVGATQLEAQR